MIRSTIVSVTWKTIFCLVIGWFIHAPSVGCAQEITHRFLACGNQTYIVESDGKKSWTYPHSTRDGFVLDDGRILLTLSKSSKHPGGAVVVIATDSSEKILWQGRQAEVNSAHPTRDGTIVLTEAGPQPKLIEIDSTGKVLIDFPLQCQTENHHMQTRMARKLDDNTYLVPHLHDFSVKQYNAEGSVLNAIDTTTPGDPEHKIPSWPFTAIRHDSERTLVCLTHSNRVADFDRDGKLVWSLSNDDFDRPWLQDPCGAQWLPNGNLMITSYAAGRTDPTSPKLIEVTRDKKAVWTYSNNEKIGIHHFQILDTNGVRIASPVLK